MQLSSTQPSSKTREPSTAQDVITMQNILEKLYRAESISRQESQALFGAIIRGELEASQLAAALISMKVRGEHPDEIAGAATALLADAQPFST